MYIASLFDYEFYWGLTMSLNSFYYKLLHIESKPLSETYILWEIEETIKEEMDSIQNWSSSIEGLCKVASYHIGEMLRQKGISIAYLNTKNFSCAFEHVALLVYYEISNEIKYILIDVTYEQFLPVANRRLNPKLKSWPGICLMENNFSLYENLCTKGYSSITIKDLNDYMKSFGYTNNLNNNLFDVILHTHKKK